MLKKNNTNIKRVFECLRHNFGKDFKSVDCSFDKHNF